MFHLNRKPVQDERLVALRRKINSEAFGILYVALLGVLLVKIYILRLPKEEFLTEAVLFFGICFYVVVRMIMLGLHDQTAGKAGRKPFYWQVGIAAVIHAATMGVISLMQGGSFGFWEILGSTPLFVLVFGGIFWLSEWSAKRQEERMLKDSDE